MTDTANERPWKITITDDTGRPLTPSLIEWELRGLRPVIVRAQVNGPSPAPSTPYVRLTDPAVKVQVFIGHDKSECETQVALVKTPLDHQDGGGVHPRHVPAFMDVIARASMIADEMNAAFDAEWEWARTDGEDIGGRPGWLFVNPRTGGVRACVLEASIRDLGRAVIEGETRARGVPPLPDEAWAIATLAGELAGER